jgi:mannose-1-phosphate guanylyltransferase
MKVMVLAAGKGTRLHSLTETLPKPMLPVEGKPVLAHIIRNYAPKPPSKPLQLKNLI